MEKHSKFFKEHHWHNSSKSTLFFKILPLFIIAAILGGCKKEDTNTYFLEITEWTTSEAPSGDSWGDRPSGTNNLLQFKKGETFYEDCLGKTDWEAERKYYNTLNKYKDKKEANVREYHGGGMKLEVDLFIYNNAKSQQITDSLKQKTK